VFKTPTLASFNIKRTSKTTLFWVWESVYYARIRLLHRKTHMVASQISLAVSCFPS